MDNASKLEKTYWLLGIFKEKSIKPFIKNIDIRVISTLLKLLSWDKKQRKIFLKI